MTCTKRQDDFLKPRDASGHKFIQFKVVPEIALDTPRIWATKYNGQCNDTVKVLAHSLQVVLAASICTRGGKAILSRQFREIARSRIEGLLAAFPKLADSGTQHTTVEQDNVRYVYQPLDELYMVLITNRQSNILQDIDSLHLFAQVVTTICKSVDEREILRNAYELLSAFDEVVTLGFRENLPIAQIKKFLEMESNEERIQEIIAKVGKASSRIMVELIIAEQRTRSYRSTQRCSQETRDTKKTGGSKWTHCSTVRPSISHIYSASSSCHSGHI